MIRDAEFKAEGHLPGVTQSNSCWSRLIERNNAEVNVRGHNCSKFGDICPDWNPEAGVLIIEQTELEVVVVLCKMEGSSKASWTARQGYEVMSPFAHLRSG
jgi:hypothetical protein